MEPMGPKMAYRVWKLLLTKFFDPSNPSMKKVDDGEKKEKKEKK